ncbi:RidA family protein [Pseudemcibacter aquimaris]|uniref:RidA family protein n=1 Tax=Pseudemcibacter aquimaris TaxID=2857064 RepID=UPI002012810C|nr:RidA family protein [Pseudemcibacter aquimaris]MCC3861085.1 RidA family protein [Pseudemcibacter aquimaris]WDU59903.1 RidA family protein [Pseudemcibacter aquimaris]
MLRRTLFASAAAALLAACGKTDDPAPEAASNDTPAGSGGKIDAKLAELGVELPEASVPIAAYTPWRKVDNIVYIAGQGPSDKGTVGKDYTTEQAYELAKEAVILSLSQLKAACGGDLDRVKQCVQLQCIVRSTSDFTEQHLVANGASELLRDIFGDAGLAARAAVGTNSLPVGFVVEIIATFEVA